MYMKPISLAICTFNRAENLRVCLQSLADVSTELQSGDEIIVLNNNCTDHTEQVIAEFGASLPVRSVMAPEQGLAAARNKALDEFCSQVLVFIDDDVRLADGFINAYRHAHMTDQYDFWGGQLRVDWDGPKPRGLQREDLPLLSGLLGHYDPAPDGAQYDFDIALPFGANFAVSRNLVNNTGRFDTRLGVKGTGLGRGEETEYFQRALELGFRGRYLRNALAYHRVDQRRLSIVQLLRFGIAKGQFEVGQAANPRSGSIVQAILFGVKAIAQLIKGRRDRYYQSLINSGIEIGLSQRTTNEF
ncbi:MAG: glycosyltransferase [Gammaproteobacteria bacterium]|nr:glycosyltransferase [Gammaproteobacteria bacterium]